MIEIPVIVIILEAAVVSVDLIFVVAEHSFDRYAVPLLLIGGYSLANAIHGFLGLSQPAYIIFHLSFLASFADLRPLCHYYYLLCTLELLGLTLYFVCFRVAISSSLLALSSFTCIS
jgi:hypothetical protein